MKTKAKIGKCAIPLLVNMQLFRAVRVALMSLGMTFSFTPEVQITKNYCKNTMKYTGVTLGSIISC